MKYGRVKSRPACVASCWRCFQESESAVGADVSPLTASFCQSAHSKHAHGMTTKSMSSMLWHYTRFAHHKETVTSLHHSAYASVLRLCRQQAWGLLKGSCRITASGSALLAAVLPDFCRMHLRPSLPAPQRQQCSQIHHHQRAAGKRGTQRAPDRSPHPRAAHSRGQKLS